jgi:asparagine synthase (glutamine-hydrolysing)
MMIFPGARQVAEHLAPAVHLVLGVQEFPRFFDDLPAVASGMDEPAPFSAASARVRHIAELLAARSVQAHFNGQGGDEVLLAPLTYLHNVLRARPQLGWWHLRGQAALRDLRLPRLASSVLAQPAYSRWLRWAAQALRAEAPAETDAGGWEAQPLLPRWASRDAELLVRAAILAASPTAVEDRSTHAALVRIRSTAYRAALYRDALAGHGVSAAFPFFDRAVLEAALAVRPWERTDPWQPKPLLRATLGDTVPARLLARRTKAHYNEDIYRGWMANRQRVAEFLDHSWLAELGLIDVGVLRRCLRSFGPSALAPAFVTDTIACEVWLRSLAPPFTHRREADNARTRHQRGPGPRGIEYVGGRWSDVAG